MKKGTMAEKLAQKSFKSAAIQQSWQIHLQAFGPILEPAFADNAQARIHLTAALNLISNREIQKGLEKLTALENACSTGEDRAAWFFCMGLCFEMANRKEDMIACYQKAGDYGHRFYLPYLKVAKAAHGDAVFEVAEENYAQAIQCLQGVPSDRQNAVLLGSAYTNYASCLTMMHRYEEATEALLRSTAILPEQPGRSATEAILEAAKGHAEKAISLTEKLAAEAPLSHGMTHKMVTDILEGRHPHFCPVALAEGSIEGFWSWFEAHEVELLQKLAEKDHDSVFRMMRPKLKDVFPFMERDLDFAIEPKEEFYRITFADYFMVSLKQGYRQLIAAAPSSSATRWRWDITR